MNSKGRLIIMGTGQDERDVGTELYRLFDKPASYNFVKNPYRMTKQEAERGNKLKKDYGY